jgi:NAD(P)-dependent dehydrogenase (short-subunit alcohol dehydrogenase family)
MGDEMNAHNGTLIVTGGSKGIGRAICLLAAERGYDIVFNHRGTDASVADLTSAIEKSGQRVIAISADLSEPDAVDRLFAAADEIGNLSGLVNNAGITGATGPFLATNERDIRKVFEVNVFALMECCRQAVARMSVSGGGNGGSIVNLSSGAAQTGSPGTYVWYGASKAAVETFTLGLAREVAGEGIRVNALSPGVTDTGIHQAGGRAKLENIVASIPLGRMAAPSEIAEPALWLLSPAASYVTGTVIRAGGGR